MGSSRLRGYRRSTYIQYRRRRARRNAALALLLLALGLAGLGGYLWLHGRSAPESAADAAGIPGIAPETAAPAEPGAGAPEPQPEDLRDLSGEAIRYLRVALATAGAREEEARVEEVLAGEPPVRHTVLRGRYSVLAGEPLDEKIAAVSAGLRVVGASPLVRAGESGAQELSVLFRGLLVAEVSLEERGPVVAIIIDDCGYPRESDAMVLALPYPVTVAVLPGLVNSRSVAEKAVQVGKEVILHMPMEALGDVDAGEGAIKVGHSPEAIRDFLLAAIDYVPQAVGVSNHMGSRVTQDERAMRAVMAVLAERGLFFVDSLTTPDSVACAVAAEMGVPCVRRDVFIDNEYEAGYIKEQLALLAQRALTTGRAIGIGHSSAVTVAALAEVLPEFEEKGISVVGVSRLVR